MTSLRSTQKPKLRNSLRVMCPKDRNNHKQSSSSRWMKCVVHPSIHAMNTQMDEENAQRPFTKNSKQAPLQNEGHVSQARHKKHEQFSQTNGYNVRPIHPVHGWMKGGSGKGWKRRVDDVAPLLKSHQTNQAPPLHRSRVKCRNLAQAPPTSTSTDNPGRMDEQNVRPIHPCSTGMDEGNVRRMKREMHPASEPVVERWRVGGKSEGRRSWSGG